MAAAPAWLKEGSEGDFSRDFEWAGAAERAGVPYYPKLVLGVPATPATGRRILVAEGEPRGPAVARLVEAAREVVRAEEAGGLHVLFTPAEEALELERAGLARRVDFQYHWRNQGDATMAPVPGPLPARSGATPSGASCGPPPSRASPSGRCAATSWPATRAAGPTTATSCTAARPTRWPGACAG